MKELEEINDYTFKKVVSLLFKVVPEYKVLLNQNHQEISFPEDGVYFFMYEFATFLGKEFISNPSSNFVGNSFNYINILGDSNNLELLNIVKVGILETLYTSNGLDRNEVHKRLNEKLKKHFTDFSKYYV